MCKLSSDSTEQVTVLSCVSARGNFSKPFDCFQVFLSFPKSTFMLLTKPIVMLAIPRMNGYPQIVSSPGLQISFIHQFRTRFCFLSSYLSMATFPTWACQSQNFAAIMGSYFTASHPTPVTSSNPLIWRSSGLLKSYGIKPSTN